VLVFLGRRHSIRASDGEGMRELRGMEKEREEEEKEKGGDEGGTYVWSCSLAPFPKERKSHDSEPATAEGWGVDVARMTQWGVWFDLWGV